MGGRSLTVYRVGTFCGRIVSRAAVPSPRGFGSRADSSFALDRREARNGPKQSRVVRLLCWCNRAWLLFAGEVVRFPIGEPLSTVRAAMVVRRQGPAFETPTIQSRVRIELPATRLADQPELELTHWPGGTARHPVCARRLDAHGGRPGPGNRDAQRCPPGMLAGGHRRDRPPRPP